MAHSGRPREFREEEVLDRGIEYFRIHGYGGGGLTGLLEWTGLSRQSLYNSFGDKGHFFKRCLERYRRVWGERLFARLRKEDAGLDDLREVLLEVVAFLAGEPEKNCLIIKSTMELGISEEAVMEQIRLHAGLIEEGVGKILQNERRGKGKGRGHQKEDERTVALVLAVIFGLHVMARGGLGEKRMADAVDRLVDSLNV